MKNIITIVRRELQSYFTTPLAYIFVAVFLGLAGLFTFKLGNFYEARQANLSAFFLWHPWLYLFLVPAISMRLWAEERKSGTIELMFTLPVTLGQAVVGKFLAGWGLLLVALVLTFPIAWTAFALGDPDNGQVIAGYIGSFLMAGAYLAVGCCISAWTKNQVISFVISLVVCFLFMVAHFPVVTDLFAQGPQWLVNAVDSMSFIAHFEAIGRGVIELKDVVFFLSMIGIWLYACAAVLDYKKAQ